MRYQKLFGRRAVAGAALVSGILFLGNHAVNAQETDEVVLKAITYAAPSAYDESIVAFKEYIERVNQEADGRLRIEYIGGPEVVGVRNQIDALREGIVDMVVTFTAHESLVPVVGTVGLSRLTPAEEREAGYFDIMVEDHRKKGIQPIGRMSTDSGFFIFSNTKIDELADFEELRIRSHSGYDPFFEALGAAPIHMKISEIYPALERGLVDAAPYTLFVHSLGLHEVVDYALGDAFWPSHTTWLYINAERYDSLSEDLQDVLMQTQIELEDELDGIVDSMQAEERRKLEEAGIEFTSLSEEDRRKFRDFADQSRWDALKGVLGEEKAAHIRSIIAPQ